MIGVVGDDHAASTRHGARHSPREVVGLAPRIGKEDHFERFGKHPSESVRVADDVLDEVPGVGIQPGCLHGECSHHLRVAMTHMCHVVVRVEKSGAGTVG